MAGRYSFAASILEKYGGNHIVEGLKKVMSPDASNEKDFIPPEYIGEGKLICLLSNDSYDVYSNELQLTKNVPLSGGTEGPLYAPQFCMGSNMEWQEKESGAQLQLQPDQGAFSFIANVLETYECQAGERYKSFRVNFSNSKIERMVEEFGIKIDAFARKKMNFSISCFETPPECKIAVDNHISNPIPLAKLSRMVYLNEYKLKTGFKKISFLPRYKLRL